MTDLQMVGLEDREKAAVRDRGKIREEGGTMESGVSLVCGVKKKRMDQ